MTLPTDVDAAAAFAASPFTSLTVPLWPAEVAARRRWAPVMRVTVPPRSAEELTQGAAPRPAMVIFRGGAYATCTGSGAGAGLWAAAHGLVAFEVEYGTAGAGQAYPQPYADAARAVRLVRARAAEWGVDPARVAVMGFSAGGHLTSLLSTQPSLYLDPDDDLAPALSARPDLAILAYPVISFVEAYRPGAYVGSAANFLGPAHPEPDLETRRRFSSELHVTPEHPPVFLWTTRDDALVPYTHSTLFADALHAAGVPVDFTLYPSGAHGLGLALDEPPPLGEWTHKLAAWLAARLSR
jgi:acetyl esterase/lipase